MSTNSDSEAKRGRKISRDHRLLDSAKLKFGIESDAALASWLGITKQEIYSVRAGRRSLGFIQRLKLLDHIAFQNGVRFVAEIANKSLAEKFLEWSRNIASSQAQAMLARVNWHESNVALLDAAKVLANKRTDAELAELLDLKPNTISMIRTGRSGLGERPRIKILALLWKELGDINFDHERFAATVNDPDKIAEAIESYKAEAAKRQ